MNAIKAWWAKPYSADMNVTGWLLMLGLFMIGSLMWAMILGHIRSAVED
jgi:hypothetical protein